MRLNDERIPVARLAGRVGVLFSDKEPDSRVLFLAADDELNYEAVMRIVDVAKSTTENLRIGIVTAAPVADAQSM